MPSNTPQTRRGKHTLQRWATKWTRWLHIYLSMLSLGAILFFSVTGLTLNHPDWFFSESTEERTGTLDTQWLNIDQAPPRDWDETDFGHQIDKLAIVEFLRDEHHLSGRVEEFIAFEDECELTFQGPGYAATARIERASGDYQLLITCNDLISILNDYHKGRHTGPVWSWVIDISAVVSSIVAISGFGLIFFLRLNRSLRLAIGLIGAILISVLMFWLR